MQEAFIITHIRYNNNETRDYIILLLSSRVSIINSSIDKILAPDIVWKKSQLIDLIQLNQPFYTAFTVDGKISLGEKIEVYPKENPKFLRSNSEPIEKDDLGELPLFLV